MTNGEIIRRVREGINKVESTLLVLSLCVALVEFGYAGAELDNARRQRDMSEGEPE